MKSFTYCDYYNDEATVTNITLKYIAENSLHLNNIPPKDLFQSIYCAPQQQTLLLFSLRHTFLLILELRNTECVPEYLTSFAAIKVLISSFLFLTGMGYQQQQQVQY